MSATTTPIVTGVDFIGLPTRDLDAARVFYGETLGLPCTAWRPDRHHGEFQAGNLTLNILNPEGMGLEYVPSRNAIALHVDDVAEARATLEERGVPFMGDIFDTGVCHMAFFEDPAGNALMLHHRYAPKEPAS
jgi:predicted enzyme related to lactoylglutathione lyase